MAVISARSALAAMVKDPGGVLVATDFDGTLSPMTSRPEEAHASPEAVAALAQVGERVGSVAIITGRSPRTVLQLADLSAPGLSDLVILGQYGVERWDARSREFVEPPPPPGIAPLADELPAFLEQQGVPAELEFKGRAVGVHLRNVPDPDEATRRLERPLRELAARHDLTVQPGRLILEVCSKDQDKGHALRALIAEREATGVIYLGDDLGDIPAFEAVAALRETGFPAIAVCAASAEQQALVPMADAVVDAVPGVTRWLEQFVEALPGVTA